MKKKFLALKRRYISVEQQVPSLMSNDSVPIYTEVCNSFGGYHIADEESSNLHTHQLHNNQPSNQPSSQHHSNQQRKVHEGYSSMPFATDPNWGEKVCSYLDITLYSAYTAILHFVLSSKMGKSNIERLLLLLQMFLPESNTLATSKHKFFNQFEVIERMEKWFICRSCQSVNLDGTCTTHGQLTEFLLWANPLDSFSRKLMDPDYFKLAQYYRTNRTEIREKGRNGTQIWSVYDSEQYRSVADPITQNPDGYSFVVNDDGASKWKSSLFSANPIYLQCQEFPLPERIQKEYVIFCGCWYGREKLDRNILYSLLVKEFLRAEYGIPSKRPDGTPATIKARLINSTLDNPAKAAVFKINQAGGENACAHCNIKGCSISGRMCYAITKQDGIISDLSPRIETEVRAIWASIAQLKRSDLHGKTRPEKGIKDIPVLAALPYFLWTKFGSVELLHYAENIFKTLIKVWTYPKFNNGTARISKSQWLEFERVLLQQLLPELFARGVRSVEKHFKYFKASEALVFLLYTSRLLCYFDWFRPYAEHHLTLVNILLEVLTPGKTLAELDVIKQRCVRWVLGFQTLYGAQYVTYMLHLTIHLVDSVKMHGPLTHYSAFPFESFNSIIMNSIHGTNKVEKGIANAVPLYQHLQFRLKMMSLHSEDKIAMSTFEKFEVCNNIIEKYNDPSLLIDSLFIRSGDSTTIKIQ